MEIRDLALSPTGQQVAVVTPTHCLVYDASGDFVHGFEVPDETLVSFSDSGVLQLASSIMGMVYSYVRGRWLLRSALGCGIPLFLFGELLAVHDGRELTVHHQGRLVQRVIPADAHTFGFDRRGRRLVMANDREVILAGGPRYPLPHVEQLAVSPGGSYLAVRRDAYAIDVIHLRSNREVLPGFPGHPAIGLDVSPDGTVLSAATRGGGVVLWDIPSRSVRAVLDEEPEPQAVRFSSEGRLIAPGRVNGDTSGDRVLAWDPATSQGEQLGRIDEAPELIDLSQDGSVWVWVLDNVIRVGHQDLGERIVPQGTDERVDNLAISADGRWLAIAWLGGVVDLLDLDTSLLTRHRVRERGAAVYAFAFSPLGNALAFGDMSGMVHVWDTTRHVCDRRVYRAGCVSSLTWSPDGRLIAVGYEDGIVEVWKQSTRTARYASENGEVYALCFLPNGKTLVSAHRDTTLLLWEVPTSQTDESRSEFAS